DLAVHIAKRREQRGLPRLDSWLVYFEPSCSGRYVLPPRSPHVIAGRENDDLLESALRDRVAYELVDGAMAYAVRGDELSDRTPEWRHQETRVADGLQPKRTIPQVSSPWILQYATIGSIRFDPAKRRIRPRNEGAVQGNLQRRSRTSGKTSRSQAG